MDENEIDDYDREAELGAVFYETVLWERPFWYESNAGLVAKFGDAVMPRTAEWESRWWSPIINAEHLQMRETAGLVDLTAFAMFDITGPGALATVQRVCVRQMDVAVGKVKAYVESAKADFVVGPVFSNILGAIAKPVLDSGAFLISPNAGPSTMAGKRVRTSTLLSRRAALARFFSSGRSQCWITREPPIIC